MHCKYKEKKLFVGYFPLHAFTEIYARLLDLSSQGTNELSGLCGYIKKGEGE